MSQTSALKVGGDIKYHCPRCDLVLAHTIIAMAGREPARIRCNTCKSERNYRAPKPERVKTEPLRRTRAPISDEGLYNQKLKETALQNSKKYRIDEILKTNDVVEHPTFGRGVVMKTIFPDRVEILFKDQSRVLMAKVES